MSGFTVTGTLDGTLYEVQVTGDPDRPVVGSKRVTGLVRQYVGETVLVTPAGPAYIVDASDPATVLALLSAHTKVSRVDGDAPRLVDPLPEGAVW